MSDIKWHLYATDKPKKSGDYLTVCDLGRLRDEDEKPYGVIGINAYHVKGEEIAYTAPGHYAHIVNPYERLMTILTHPDVQVSEGSFYEYGEDDDEYPIGNVIYWAELPAVPDVFMGDQNLYLTECDAP